MVQIMVWYQIGNKLLDKLALDYSKRYILTTMLTHKVLSMWGVEPTSNKETNG